MSSRAKSVIITFFIIGIPVLFMFVMKCGRTIYRPLPHLGNIEGINPNGDTIFHTIKDFSFIDQQGQVVTNHNFDSCIYVASYFFATCPDVCPRMNANLQRVYDRYKSNPKVKFISYTVDPDHDTPAELLKYANALNVDHNKWYFVTGNKDSLYKLATESYLIQAGVGDAMPISFIHDQTFVLVDQNRYIRATFDGLAPEKMDELTDAIQLLLTDMRLHK